MVVKALWGVAPWGPGTQGQVIPPSEGLPHLQAGKHSLLGRRASLFGCMQEMKEGRKRRLLEENQGATEH